MGTKPNYGVIVGRFQVHNLHAGHLELFRQVASQHKRVIVFIGVAPTGPTRRNPLDFETRKKMVQAEYPDFICVPLADRKYDEVWSRELDDKISEIVVYGDATLYGGRDSFLPHYSGKRKVHELVLPKSISGTDVRADLTDHVMQSADFRAGIIYTLQNMFPKVVTTVDIAIINRSIPDSLEFTSVLLGRKEDEARWRFIGGHAVPRRTFEEQARTETMEESTLDLMSLTYIGSEVIDDWRWKREEDGVVTLFFVGESMTRAAKAADDIAEVRWFPVERLEETNLEEAHRALFRRLMKHLKGPHAAAVPASATASN